MTADPPDDDLFDEDVSEEELDRLAAEQGFVRKPFPQDLADLMAAISGENLLRRYKPATQNGRPVAVYFTVRVEFTLL